MSKYLRALTWCYMPVLWTAAFLITVLPTLAGPPVVSHSGDPAPANQTLTVQLSAQGDTALNLPCPAGPGILQLQIDGGGLLTEVRLERLPAALGKKPQNVVAGPFRNGEIRLPLRERQTDLAADARCRLELRGLPAAQLTFTEFAWSFTLRARLGGMWHDWITFRPWSQASINSHQATVHTWHGMVPTVLLGLLFITVGAAGFLRWRTGFLLWWMVACWLVLDLPWQWRLHEQLLVTKDRFAGVAAQKKPGLTNDAELWAFAERVRALLPAAGSRAFVASVSDYDGMRMAYYLYPLNVYWRRGGPELPASATVQEGDYIIVVQPSELSGDPESGHLVLGGDRWKARPLLAAHGTVLFEAR